MVSDSLLTNYDSIFRAREEKLNGHASTAWHAYRQTALDRLKAVQFPDRKHEDWRYTPVNRLLGNEALPVADASPARDLPSIPGLESHVIIVRNGVSLATEWPDELRTAGIRLQFLDEVFDDPAWQPLLRQSLPGADADAGRAFDLLNAAFHTHALCIDIPANLVLSKPIELRIHHDAEGPSMSNPLCLVRVGSGSEVQWIERFEGNPGAATALVNAAAYIHLEPNASLTHTRWQDLPDNQRLVYKLSVTQGRDSRFTSQLFDHGGDVIRNTLDIDLEAPGTFTSLEGAYVARDRQSVTHQTRINHRVPHCESHEWYKGILDGSGSAAFNGKVFVHPDAQKTNAYQQNDALVLSPHALMNSKPQLEIFADDVRCSHGATIGQMNPESLFYLRSRGLSDTTARKMLQSAFLAPLVEHVGLEPVRAYIAPKMGILV